MRVLEGIMTGTGGGNGTGQASEQTAGDMIHPRPIDMEPAMAEGIFSIHLAETKDSSLDCVPLRIKSLADLLYILSDDDSGRRITFE